MPQRNLLHLFPGCLLAALLLTSCGKPPSSAVDFEHGYQPVNGGTTINAMIGEPSGLIPMIAGESAASAIASSIFNSLLKYDRNLELEGELAKSWDISPYQRTITFHL
jgi:peptide/nickel transport system substrate-binding protein